MTKSKAKQMAREPEPIQQTETQRDNYSVRPEFFQVRRYSDPIDKPFHGQGENDEEAQKRSREAEFNRGSVRAKANVKKPGAPHTKIG